MTDVATFDAGRPVAAVFFDGDQTLWDFRAVMRRALAETLAELQGLRPGPATDDLDVASLMADRREAVRRLGPGELRLDRIRRAAFEGTLERIGLPDPALAATLTDFYLERRFSGVEPYPDVIPALAALAPTYRLGLLSNGNSYPDRCGLAGAFDAVVLAEDHGWAKPDRRLFDAAAAALEVDGRHCLMVGDSPVNDVAGAQAAGWRAIWLCRDGEEAEAATGAGIRPDAVVTSLLALPAAVAGLAPALTDRPSPPELPELPGGAQRRRG